MAGVLYQDWENYNPNNPTALRPPSYWDAVKENLPHALSGIKRMPSNVLGFPADIYSAAGYGADRLSAHPELQQEYMNMMFNDSSLRPYENVRREELVSDKPMFTNKAPLGSEWIAEKMGLPERTGHPTELWSEISSEFALPFLGKSALSAGKIVKEKLPEVVGKHVPEPFRTPITGLNIAKVYNKEGKLIDKVDDVVYHGTNKSFDKFSDEFKAIAGSSTDETLPKAHWFTDDPVTAGYYSEKAASSTYLGVDKSFIPENRMGMKVFRDGGTGGENIRPSILNAKLLDLDMKGGSFQGRGYNKVNSKIREAKKDGYDGLRIRNYSDPANFSGITKEHRPSTHYAIFEGSKIDSALSPNLSKEAPKIENLNFNELLTAWTVDQTKVPRKLLSDKLSTPENKNRTIKALNNLGYKDTVPVYRTVRYKGELKDEDLISASLTPEANINFTKFSTEGKTINPLSDNPVPQDFAILRYDVPINDVKGYLPEFAGDIKRTVNKKIKNLGIGQEKISGLKTVTNPSAHAKQLLSTQDEIIADVSKIKPKVLQHYGLNKNLNPLSSELSIPSEIAKGKITKPSDLPSNYSVLPFPKGGINAPKEAWDAWAKNEEIAKKEMIKYYKEFYNIK